MDKLKRLILFEVDKNSSWNKQNLTSQTHFWTKQTLSFYSLQYIYKSIIITVERGVDFCFFISVPMVYRKRKRKTLYKYCFLLCIESSSSPVITLQPCNYKYHPSYYTYYIYIYKRPSQTVLPSPLFYS
jgi:hypothetical protein